jgi:hypothetical protein
VPPDRRRPTPHRPPPTAKDRRRVRHISWRGQRGTHDRPQSSSSRQPWAQSADGLVRFPSGPSLGPAAPTLNCAPCESSTAPSGAPLACPPRPDSNVTARIIPNPAWRMPVISYPANLACEMEDGRLSVSIRTSAILLADSWGHRETPPRSPAQISRHAMPPPNRCNPRWTASAGADTLNPGHTACGCTQARRPGPA